MLTLPSRHTICSMLDHWPVCRVRVWWLDIRLRTLCRRSPSLVVRRWPRGLCGLKLGHLGGDSVLPLTKRQVYIGIKDHCWSQGSCWYGQKGAAVVAMGRGQPAAEPLVGDGLPPNCSKALLSDPGWGLAKREYRRL
jgi:hypothetical protein